MAVTELARCVARLRKRQPATPKEIELWAYAQLDLRVGPESIRKALNGDVDPTQCAMELLIALAGFYGVAPSGLGRFAEVRLRGVLAFASTVDGPDTPPGQEIHRSGWTDEPGGHVLAFPDPLAA